MRGVKRICVDLKGFNGKLEKKLKKLTKTVKNIKKHLLFYKVYYIIIFAS